MLSLDQRRPLYLVIGRAADSRETRIAYGINPLMAAGRPPNRRFIEPTATKVSTILSFNCWVAALLL
jgi:hypothetical protein